MAIHRAPSACTCTPHARAVDPSDHHLQAKEPLLVVEGRPEAAVAPLSALADEVAQAPHDVLPALGAAEGDRRVEESVHRPIVASSDRDGQATDLVAIYVVLLCCRGAQ